MAKYHINPETGKPNLCQAKKKCRYAVDGQNPEHYETKEIAQQAYEIIMEQETIVKLEKARQEKIAKQEEQAKIILKMDQKIEETKNVREMLEQRYENNRPIITEEFVAIKNHDQKLIEHNNEYKILEQLITNDEKEAVYKYAGVTYEPINKFLYSDDKENYIFNKTSDELNNKVKTRLLNYVDLIDSYIAKSPKTEKPRNLYRIVSQDTDEIFVGSEEYAEQQGYEVGKEITFKGFSSTSIDPGFIAHKASYDQHSDIVFVMNTDKGAPIDYTKLDNKDFFNVQDSEREILLPRNSQFKITKIERARFFDRDGESAEPLTIFLEEVDKTEEN